MADETLTLLAELRDEVSAKAKHIKRELDSVATAAERANRTQQKSAESATKATQKQTTSVSGLTAAYNRHASTVTKVRKETNHLIGLMGGGLVVASAAGAAALTAWGVKTSSSIEQTTIALETFTGDYMPKLFDQIRQLDKESIFTFNDLAAGARQLSAFGIANEQIAPLSSSISAIAAGSGKGLGGLQQLTLAISQVKSAGKLSGDEARQLSEFFNVYELAGQIYGKSAGQVKQAIEAGATVPADVIIGAITNLSGNLERFRGLNERQLDTLQGRWSAFQSDMMVIAGGAPGQPGVFAPLTNELKNELPNATTILGDSLKELGPSISEAAIALLHFSEALVPIATPVIVEIFGGLADGLNAMTPALTKMDSQTVGDKMHELVVELVKMAPAMTDLLIAMAPVISDLATLATNVLPHVIGPLSTFASVLADVTSNSNSASTAIGVAITAFLTWRLIGPAITKIREATVAMAALNTASIASPKGALVKGGLAAAGVAGLGAYGIYEGAKAKEGSAGSALGYIGGGAALGAAGGSVIPGVGTLTGGIVGGVGGGAAFLIDKYFGDVAGNYASTVASHSGVEAMTPGARTITSGVRNYGLVSGKSGHLNGTAVDVNGSWMAAYRENVKRSGGWAKQHDAGNGMHVHAQYGDAIGSASSTSTGWAMPPITVNVTAYSQLDYEGGIKRAIRDYERERLKRQ